MNSVRIGYGKNLVEYDPQHPFFIKLPALKRVPLSPFEEAQSAAVEIYEKLGGPPTLCLSGGLDSECMALAFLAAGLPFRVATMVFEDGLNAHDSAHALSFCKENNIPHDLIHLDVVKFFNSGDYMAYVKKYYCHTPELAAQLWFLDQIKGPFVLAGEAFRVFQGEKGAEIQSVSEFEAVFFRYVTKSNSASIWNFHFFSSELAWSFFRISLQKNYRKFDEYDTNNFRQKLEFYRASGFPARDVPERIRKLHGFENLKIYYDKLLSQSADSYNERFRIPVTLEFPLAKKTYVDIPKKDLIAKTILS